MSNPFRCHELQQHGLGHRDDWLLINKILRQLLYLVHLIEMVGLSLQSNMRRICGASVSELLDIQNSFLCVLVLQLIY